MKLVLVAHGSRAALKIAHVGIVVGHDERTLKLSGIAGVDAEITAQFHWAAHSLGDIDEGAVAEHCRVEGCKEVVAIRHHGSQILAHQIGMILHCLTDR